MPTLQQPHASLIVAAHNGLPDAPSSPGRARGSPAQSIAARPTPTCETPLYHPSPRSNASAARQSASAPSHRLSARGMRTHPQRTPAGVCRARSSDSPVSPGGSPAGLRQRSAHHHRQAADTSPSAAHPDARARQDRVSQDRPHSTQPAHCSTSTKPRSKSARFPGRYRQGAGPRAAQPRGTLRRATLLRSLVSCIVNTCSYNVRVFSWPGGRYVPWTPAPSIDARR